MFATIIFNFPYAPLRALALALALTAVIAVSFWRMTANARAR